MMNTTLPKEQGLYVISCMESKYKEFYIAITKDENRNLHVHDEHLGRVGLQYYFDGLTEIKYKKVA